MYILEQWSSRWLLKFNPNKTKAVFFTTKSSYELPEIFFQHCKLEYISTHKHLGLHLASDLKWSEHINIIVNKALKKLGLLKKLKFSLGKNSLSKMYITFVRPILEYASVVWDGCSQHDIDKLEKVQLYAARIVTGLPIIASKTSLYFETGWETLSARRMTSKLTTMYKIHNKCVPEYLSQIIPNTRSNDSAYRTRNIENYSLPRCRTELFKKSFIPDTIQLWNTLSIGVRNETSIQRFKNSLYKTKNIAKAPSFFTHGKRKLNIIHTKLRHHCILNYDLHRINIIESGNCRCGSPEDAYHFFFKCKNYTIARNNFFLNLLQLDHFRIINTHLLLWGDESLSLEINKQLFSLVQLYINETGRFV